MKSTTKALLLTSIISFIEKIPQNILIDADESEKSISELVFEDWIFFELMFMNDKYYFLNPFYDEYILIDEELFAFCEKTFVKRIDKIKNKQKINLKIDRRVEKVIYLKNYRRREFNYEEK